MKKRFLCLVLCMVMIIPAILTGCSDVAKTDETEDTSTTASTSSAKAMTITLYGITEKSTTDEAIAMVQEAINRITEKDFNTHVLLKLFSESEYDSVIAEKIKAIEEQKIAEEEAAKAKKEAEKAAKEAAKAAAAAGQTTTEAQTSEETSETDETIINAYGLEETLYPAEKGTQLDIFLIRNFETLQEYNELGILASLDEELSIGSKILKQYIHPSLFSATKVNGKTVAIPNNHVIGEYQYLLLDKGLMDKYYYDPEDIKSITDIEDFLLDVIKYEPDYIPLLNKPDSYIRYFTEEPSLLGAYVSKDAALGASAAPKNLLSVSQYMNYYKMMRNLTEQNAIVNGSINDGKKFAATVITGDCTTPEVYEDNYYVSVYKYPTATSQNVYSGMYAVSTYAADVARCMEVVTLLTKDADMVNLMQYGIKGVHYDLNEVTGVVEYLNKDYSMNMNYTGNQFLMYQNENMTDLQFKLSDNNWALAKLQNLDMTYDPLMGFTLAYTEEDKEGNVTDIKVEGSDKTEYTIKELMKKAVEVSNDYLKRLDEFVEYEEEQVETYRVRTKSGEIETRERSVMVTVTFDDFISNITKEASKDPILSTVINAKLEKSPISQYNTWYAAAYPAPAA